MISFLSIQLRIVFIIIIYSYQLLIQNNPTRLYVIQNLRSSTHLLRLHHCWIRHRRRCWYLIFRRHHSKEPITSQIKHDILIMQVKWVRPMSVRLTTYVSFIAFPFHLIKHRAKNVACRKLYDELRDNYGFRVVP